MRVILSGVIGVAVGGVSSSIIVAMMGPVFHWEMAGMAMVIFSSLAGGFVATLVAAGCALTNAAPATNAFVGLWVGAGVGFAGGQFVVARSSARVPGAPEGLAFWAIAVIVIAAGLAGLISGMMGNTISPE